MLRPFGTLLAIFACVLAVAPASTSPSRVAAPTEQILPWRRPRPLPAPQPRPAPTPAPDAPANSDFVGGATHDGRTVRIDLPASEHLRNKGGTDGIGLCTFASLSHSARWQYVPELIDFMEYMTHYPGGGWPDKVDEFIAKKAGKDAVQYVQCIRFDEKLLELAVKTGRMPAVTYGYSPRYGERISHMVNLVHMDEKWLVFLDNNFPGTYEWVPRAEGLRRIKLRMLNNFGRYDENGGWFVVLLAPTPPPDLK